MFTRTKDKVKKIEYDLEVMSHRNNYTFGKPGNGTTLAYMKNPNIRLQQWGANIRTNMTDIETDLRGQTRKLNRDSLDENNYIDHTVKSTPLKYETTSIKNQNTKTEENKLNTRYKNLQNSRLDILHSNPQKNIRYIIPTSTRYVEKWKTNPTLLSSARV